LHDIPDAINCVPTNNVPPFPKGKGELYGDTMSNFEKLTNIIHQLRDPNTGCPWDIKQTPQSLIPNIIEEVYEAVEAIEDNDSTHLCEELGDILLHIIFQAEIATEKGDFTIDDVIDAICDKLISRHPHIFAKENYETYTPQMVKQNWERLKQKEKKYTRESVLDGIPKSMPALIVAHRMQEKVAHVGFDWDTYHPTIDKIFEEVAEVKAEIAKLESGENDKQHLQEEIGDMFFACVNLSRKLNIDAESALRQSNEKFKARFAKVEQLCKEQNINMLEVGIEKLDEIWEYIKKN